VRRLSRGSRVVRGISLYTPCMWTVSAATLVTNCFWMMRFDVVADAAFRREAFGNTFKTPRPLAPPRVPIDQRMVRGDNVVNGLLISASANQTLANITVLATVNCSHSEQHAQAEGKNIYILLCEI
jgi:hypothetical protein